MKSLAFALSVVAIVVVATWSYNVNYETKTAHGRVAALEREIAQTREATAVLEVEWAWLNNPERLARLVDRHPELGLVPMGPEIYARASDLPPRVLPATGDDTDMPLASIETGDEELLAGLMAPAGGPVPPPRPRGTE